MYKKIKCEFCGTKNEPYLVNCKKCGRPLGLPFNMTHPQYNLIPKEDWIKKGATPVTFDFDPEYNVKFDYIEDDEPKSRIKHQLLYALKGKLGVLEYYYSFFCSDNYRKIIPAEYDSIERTDSTYICKRDNITLTFDRNGSLLSRSIG